MSAADRYTMETFGIPGFTLMESAGRAAAARIRRLLEEDARMGQTHGPVVVLCGKGNNGGDGLVVARTLVAAGVSVEGVLLHEPDALSGDPAQNWALLNRLQETRPEQLTLTTFEDLERFADRMARRRPALYVDALLGTGLTSDVRQPMRRVVDWLNAEETPVVSIDVPTGLHSDTGAVLGSAVEASYTVTMAAPKAGLLLGEGPRVAGTVDTAEIGIPDFALRRQAAAEGAWRTTDRMARRHLPTRSHAAYKYSAGMAVVVGGAPGFSGAPALSAQAAARVGAGYVACTVPAAVQAALAGTMTAIPVHALPDDTQGLVPDDALSRLRDHAAKADALLVGPGLGRGDGTQRFVRKLLRTTDQPLVIDADGLNALAGHMDRMADQSDGQWILTPHAGEFSRLAGADVSLDDRLAVARTYAQRWNSVLLLKGMPSVIGTPDGQVYIGGTGNPALATAGTGDVLAGLCAGLLAQGLAPAAAAATALHVGGTAADRYADRSDPRSMQAPDMIDAVPAVLRALTDVSRGQTSGGQTGPARRNETD
jgi:NAD(P)H-hydrate epimerase